MKKVLLVLVCVVMASFSLLLVGCAPTETGSVCEKLLEKGYEIEAYYIKNTQADEEFDVEIELEGGAYLIEGYKETAFSDREIYIFIFDKTSDINKIYKEYKTDLDSMLGEEGIVEKHGKALVVATKSAYEDYKD